MRRIVHGRPCTASPGVSRRRWRDAILDEIGESVDAGAGAVLRVLQDGEFTRIGGNDLIKSDVRVIAASNVELEKG